jgi:hypothetical protein
VWIDTEDKELTITITVLESMDPLLAAELRSFSAVRCCVNDSHRRRLQTIYELKGFTGTLPQLKDVVTGEVDVPNPSELMLVDEDDTLNDEMFRLGECLDSINT